MGDLTMLSRQRVRNALGTTLGLALLLAACNLPAQSTTPGATPTAFIFPSATPAPQTGGLSGTVWKDNCSPAAEGQAGPADCVPNDQAASGQSADGVMQPSETGIEGVVVRLGTGACPAFGLATATLDANGAYGFSDLTPGTYCVSIDASQAENAGVLNAGAWTHPEGMTGTSVASQTVTLAEGGSVDSVDFGWDVFFVPVTSVTATAEAATDTPTPEGTDTPTPAPTATFSPNDPKANLGTPTVSDSFDASSTWPTYSDDHVGFSIGDGVMHMTAANPDFYDGWTLSTPSVDNFYIEIKGQFLEPCTERDHYGIVARGVCDGGNCSGYLFALTCDGRYRLSIWDGAENQTTYLTPWTQSSAIKAGAGQSNVLGFMGDGSKLSLYANGQLLQEVTDSTYDAGLFGLFIGSAQTPDLKADVDQISMWLLP
jgi:hypothetical protein